MPFYRDFHTAPRTPTDPSTARSVSFSEAAGLAFIPKDNIEPKVYSKHDFEKFRQDLIRDVRQMKLKIASSTTSTPGANMTHEDLIEYIGLEMLSSAALMRRTMTARQAHTSAVLEAQAQAHVQGNTDDIERIAAVAKPSSREAQHRAQMLAFERACLEE